MDPRTLKVITVHPTVTIVDHDGQDQELPTAWFSIHPKTGQSWQFELKPSPSIAEQYALLNRYLSRG